jgi:putative multiple sugar transport system substrate-binding protein
MNKKLFLLMSVLVVAAMVLAACAPAATETPTEEPMETEETMEETEAPPEVTGGEVGIILPTTTEPRWLQDEARFQEAFDAAGIEVEILFSEGDVATERANVEDLITKGVQVIIYTPHDSTAAGAAAEVARDAGVKVVSYDRLITDTDAVDYYVTFDSIAVGEAQGQYLVDNASGTGNPLYLYAGAATDNNAFLFFEGAWNVLQPKIADGTFVIKNSSQAEALQDKAELTRDEMADIIGQVTTEWDFDTAKSLAEANLTVATAEDKGDVFILAPNDGTARAIADTFAADSDVSSYVVTGQDAEIASVQYIIDGKQSMTVLKDTRTLSADAIAAAAAFLAGDTPPETNTYNNGVIDVPAKPSEVVTVDQSNVQEAIIDSGYWDADEFTLEAVPTEEEVMLEPATVCLVTDLAGVDDRSFNASAWKGVNDAVDAGYAAPDPILLESDSEEDYQPNMDACLGQGATHIVSVGFQLGTATQTNAEANPDVKFTIVDVAYDPDIPNVRELIYQTDEAAFAAGYLAAGMTQTGIIGTYGGLNIPTVSIFMDGMTRGVQYYNEQKGTDVQVIGWDTELQDGQFTGSFSDMGIARTTCEGILDEGADIMLPVGGAINLPCGDAIIARGIDGALIGVDADAVEAMPDTYADLWLTTILKGIDIQVMRSIMEDAQGTWTPGGAVGNAANEAVGLAPYHSWEDAVPDDLKAEVAALLEAIAAGEVTWDKFVVE